MTKLARRPKAPTGPQPPIRIEDAVRLHENPTTYGVDPEAAKRALTAYLHNERHGMDRPYCTCMAGSGWTFDCQIGVYVHADPKCWKPSKAYYEGALRAGLLGEVAVR
jgi:hypothetical protein